MIEPSETRAEQAAREWLINHGLSILEFRMSLSDLLTRYASAARLEEAEWGRQYWHENDFVDGIHQGHGTPLENIESCEWCNEWNERIAELRAAQQKAPGEQADRK